MNPFISSDDLSAFLGEAVDPDSLLTAIALDTGCQLVRDDIGQAINLTRDRTERHDGNGREGILLAELPVIEVLAVSENDIDLVEDDDYIVDDDGLLWRRGRRWFFGWGPGWACGRGNIEVVYDSGWAISEDEVEDPGSDADAPRIDRVPAPIREVALELAAAIMRSPVTQAVGAGVTSRTIASASISYDSAIAAAASVALNEGQSRRLNRYRPGA